MIRYMTAGESHGAALTGIIEGLPAGLSIDAEEINKELARRLAGYGRGSRAGREDDKAEITAGIIDGLTTGAPIAVIIKNKVADLHAPITAPRPGHADLAGCVKYGFTDARPIAERASARETAMRTALGALCKQFLTRLGVSLTSLVESVGGAVGDAKIKRAVDAAREHGDTLGGAVTVVISGLKAGLGSHIQWDKKADARFAAALMSIQSVKAVEVGSGAEYAVKKGGEAHDAILPAPDKSGKFWTRPTNNAGGIEGGITNGEEVVLRLYFKPVPTLGAPLPSVDMRSGKAVLAPAERSDVCAVYAGAVIAENIAAITAADLILEKTGGDCMREVETRWKDLP